MNSPIACDQNASKSADTVLSIQNLSHTYSGGVMALDNVSLGIPHGIFGLLGPNGAGKSTLMRIIATLQHPTSGKVIFEGADIREKPNMIRSALGYLPQQFGVYPRMSAEGLLDHIAVLKGIGPKKVRKEQIDALLHKTNLYEVRKKKVASYSGGMKQRFGIAQALLGAPRILIVDEPTAGLDPVERLRFHELLAEIGDDVVVILSTHLLEDVAKLCPRLAILLEGKIAVQGDTPDLLTRLDGQIWKKTITREQLPEVRKELNVISVRQNGGEIQAHVLSEDTPGEGFQSIPGDLQDFYLTVANQTPAETTA